MLLSACPWALQFPSEISFRLEDLVPVVDSQQQQRAAEHIQSSPFLHNKIFLILTGESRTERSWSTECSWRTLLLGEKGWNIRTQHEQNTATVTPCDTAAATGWTKLPQNQNPKVSYTASWRDPSQRDLVLLPQPHHQLLCLTVFDYLTSNHTPLERAVLDHLAGTTVLSPSTT